MDDYENYVLGSSSKSTELGEVSSGVFEGLEAGDYTFVLTVGIPLGEKEMARVDFSYSP